MKKQVKSFAEMTVAEMEQLEKETNSVIFFDVINQEKGIVFQRGKGKVDKLIIRIDEMDDPILFIDAQIQRLKEYLNNNF